MTFYEAALRVLEEFKKPLTHTEITKISVEKGLLSHIGKTPEITMLSRLAAMARRPRDRKVMVTAKDTFALLDWMLPEDAAALLETGILETNPEEAMPAYRAVERHPEPRGDFVRAIGRTAERERKRRGDDDSRRRRFPPVSEVAFEILTEAAGPMAPADVLKRAREKELASDELSVEQVLNALLEDNQRRIDSGRRPQFTYAGIEGAAPELRLDAGGETPSNDIQLAFAAAAGVPVENGRVVLRRRDRDQSQAPSSAKPIELAPEDLALVQTARQAGKDARRAMARVLRRKLSELDSGAFEKSVVRMMHKLHFREVKVAKRTKEGPLLTARRREGSLELRYAVRLMKGNVQVERRTVSELRRDLGHYGANVGLIVSPGEVRSDAKSEALSGALVFLWCGEGLADQFFEAQAGVKVATIELYEIDEAFFADAARDAEEAKLRREERSRERDREGGPGGDALQGERAAASEGEGSAGAADSPVAAEGAAPSSDSAQADAARAEGDDDDGEDGDEEGGSGEAAMSGAPTIGPDGQPIPPGNGRRRRRRRRGRRGRGNRPDGTPGQPGAAPGAQAAAAGGTEGAPAAEASAPTSSSDAPAAAAPTPPAPSSSGSEPGAA